MDDQSLTRMALAGRVKCVVIAAVGALGVIGGPSLGAAACIEIKTAAQLNAVRNNLAGAYCLAKDIDLSAFGRFAPIGADPDHPFVGTFNGRGHHIRNLRNGGAYSGLFGVLGRSSGSGAGTVVNLTLDNPQINGSKSAPLASVADVSSKITNVHSVGGISDGLKDGNIGGLIAISDGKISNSSSSTVVENGFGGGLVGRSGGTIVNSWASGDVTGKHVGGLVNENSGTIEGSYATGAVTARMVQQYPGEAGGLAVSNSGKIVNSYATGPASGRIAGGLVASSSGYVAQSHATGSVSGTYAGGLVGFSYGPIFQSYATGAVGGNFIGGLVGSCACKISQSYATGDVVMKRLGISDNLRAGGLIGSYAGQLTRSYASGSVSGLQEDDSIVGGLIAGAGSNSRLEQTYAVGRVSGGDFRGGLIGSGAPTVIDSYWDVDTTGQATSAGGGVGRTTQQLQAALPAGFAVPFWGATPDVTYPYLAPNSIDFRSPLATTVFQSTLYTFLPISQFSAKQYGEPPMHPGEASKAVAFTMIARAIGVAEDDPDLQNELIDTDFWDDQTRTTMWTGPVTARATLGQAISLPLGEPIADSNVIGPIRARKVVILRGSYQAKGGASGTLWMLATSFTVDGEGRITNLFANDPWTGRQVRIDPGTKSVTWPSNFPLKSFIVRGYQIVTLAPPPQNRWSRSLDPARRRP